MMNRLGTACVLIVLQFTYGVQAQSPESCRGIVFDSDRTEIPPVYRMPDLYLVSSDGARERQLTFAKPGEFSRTPSVSPDGQRVVFHGRRDIDGAGLYMMTCADGQVTRVTATGTSPGLAWSPDGRQIAFSTMVGAAWAISIVDVVTKTARKLEGLPSDNSGPSWSPDGNHIAFVSRGSVTWEIFAVELGSGHVRQLTRTADPRTSSQAPAWSPDGSKIAFDRARDGNFDIYTMNADGTGIVQLTHNEGVDARPAWSPDGRSIVFHSVRDQPGSASADDLRPYDLYVMAADGSNVRRLTSNPYFDRHPEWGP
jgi:TolB protein